MDVLVGEADVAQLMRPAHLVGQHVLRQVAALVQPLPHRTGHRGLVQPRRKVVDGHDAPGEQLLPLPLHQRIDHRPPLALTIGLAVEDIRLPLVKGGLAVFLIEKGDVQHAVLVHGPHLHQRPPAGDASAPGVLGHGGPDAGVFAGDQLPHRHGARSVLPAHGVVGDQVAQRPYAQLFQRFGPGLADALDIAHVRCQRRHGGHLPSSIWEKYTPKAPRCKDGAVGQI